jgi:hypothetical protein
MIEGGGELQTESLPHVATKGQVVAEVSEGNKIEAVCTGAAQSSKQTAHLSLSWSTAAERQ